MKTREKIFTTIILFLGVLCLTISSVFALTKGQTDIEYGIKFHVARDVNAVFGQGAIIVGTNELALNKTSSSFDSITATSGQKLENSAITFDTNKNLFDIEDIYLFNTTNTAIILLYIKNDNDELINEPIPTVNHIVASFDFGDSDLSPTIKYFDLAKNFNETALTSTKGCYPGFIIMPKQEVAVELIYTNVSEDFSNLQISVTLSTYNECPNNVYINE